MPSTQYRATGIKNRELLPGFTAFDCTALKATLSLKSCAERWAKAEPGSSCSGCAIGAQHAGQTPAPPPPEHQPCVRCGSTDHRLIGKSICICCFNRQSEVMRGRNAKGSYPISIGRRLRAGFAIVRIDDANAALRQLFKRTAVTSAGWRSGLKTDTKDGLPKFERLEQSASFFPPSSPAGRNWSASSRD